LELSAVVTFQWAVELLSETLQQVFTSLLVGVRQLTFLAFKRVCVERVEREPADHFRRVEVAFAVGAVAVAFQPPFDALATEQRVTSALAALLGLLDRLQANETLKVLVKLVQACFGSDRKLEVAVEARL